MASRKRSSSELELPSYDEATSSTTPPSHHPTTNDMQLPLMFRRDIFNESQWRRQQQLLSELHIQSATMNFLRTYLRDFSKDGAPQGVLRIVSDVIPEHAEPCDDDMLPLDTFTRVVRLQNPFGGVEKWDWECDERDMRRLEEFVKGLRLDALDTEGASTNIGEAAVGGGKGKEKALFPEETLQLPMVACEVETQELCFRVQNIFGVFGTENIWGLVVKVQVHQERSSLQNW